MIRTHRTHRWRKATVVALCLVYGLVLLHPTTPDAAVTPLEWVVIGTTVASFLLDAVQIDPERPRLDRPGWYSRTGAC